MDKYIGDELMVVFSEEFGSADPFRDAVQAARAMSENDAWALYPHIGIASGRVIVGYVGTPMKYSVSVFGAAVAMAARCAGVPLPDDERQVSSSIVFPAGEWDGRDFAEICPPRIERDHDGTIVEGWPPSGWHLGEPRKVTMKNLPFDQIREILNRTGDFPSVSAEHRAREGLWQSFAHAIATGHARTKALRTPRPRAFDEGGPDAVLLSALRRTIRPAGDRLAPSVQ